MSAEHQPPRGPWRKLMLAVIAFVLAILIFALVSERHDGPVPTTSPETQAETAP